MVDSLKQTLHKLSFDTKNRKDLFITLPLQMRAVVLLQLSKHVRYSLLSSLDDNMLVETLEHLDPDEISDMIQPLSKKRQENLIKKFSEELKRSVGILTQFDPETAAGLMNLDYIQVDINDLFEVVAKKLKIHESRTGRLPTIIVMETGNLKGYVPVHVLGLARPEETITKYVKKVLYIKYNATHDEVLQFFREHPHNKIVVTGQNHDVIGIIYSDDLLRLLQEQEASSLYDFAGVQEEESVTDTVMQKVKSRYKWLIINLGTAFFASFTVGLFDATISKHVLLAVYMPIVAGMGGNAATQTLAVLVRGIAMKHIDFATAWPTLKRELIAAGINGLINGILVAAIVMLINQDLTIALILAMAMILNLLVAAFFGTVVPLIMKKFGKDPATSATIFITTATDVLGFMAFLGLASLLLS